MTEIPDKRYFRPDEVARIIERPLRTVQYWIKNDQIRHLHFGRSAVVPKEELEEIIARGVRGCASCANCAENKN